MGISASVMKLLSSSHLQNGHQLTALGGLLTVSHSETRVRAHSRFHSFDIEQGPIARILHYRGDTLK